MQVTDLLLFDFVIATVSFTVSIIRKVRQEPCKYLVCLFVGQTKSPVCVYLTAVKSRFHGAPTSY